MIALFLFAAGALAADPHTLQWPETYTISGTISLPYAEITEPFEAIMDIGAKMGRMNINNGEGWKMLGKRESIFVCLCTITCESFLENPQLLNFLYLFKNT